MPSHPSGPLVTLRQVCETIWHDSSVLWINGKTLLQCGFSMLTRSAHRDGTRASTLSIRRRSTPRSGRASRIHMAMCHPLWSGPLVSKRLAAAS